MDGTWSENLEERDMELISAYGRLEMVRELTIR